MTDSAKYLVVIAALLGSLFLITKFFRKEPVSIPKAEEKTFEIKLGDSASEETKEKNEEQIALQEEIIKKAPAVKVPVQTSAEKISIPISPPETAPAVAKNVPAVPATTTQTQTPTPEINKVKPEPKPVPPPLNEEALLQAVVKIECPTSDGQGKYIGSGFAVKGDVIITAAHVIKDSGSGNCAVIFPSKRKPIHYLRGTIIDLPGTIKLHDEQGVDFGLLKLPSLDSYPEAKAIFPEKYPYIPYPSCPDPKMFGNKLLHFGYPSNYLDQNYLSELEGEVVAQAGIDGVKSQLSEDQTYSFKTPILSFTADESAHYPYMVSRVASFYGDSGGLAFNVDQQCILGPHRGGTIGKAAGENFSIFMNVAWEGIQKIINP